MGDGQARPGAGKIRIESEGAFEHPPGEVHALARPFLKKFASAKIEFVGLHVAGGRLHNGLLLALAERQAKHDKHAAGDLVLDGKNVVVVAIEALGPQMIAVLRVDQLDGNAEPVSSLADAALQERLNAESFPDLTRVHSPGAEGEAGGSGRDPETFHPGQRVQNLFRDTVAQILLIARGAEIGEGQHRDRARALLSFLAGRRGLRPGSRRKARRNIFYSHDIQTDRSHPF